MAIKGNYTLFVLIVLSSVGFFNPYGILSPVVTKAIFYGINVYVWSIVFTKHLSNGSIYPRWCFKCLILGILTSIIMATVFQIQSFKTTFIATIPTIIAFMFFPLLMFLHIEKEKIIKVYWWLIIAGMIVYIVNFSAYPGFVFGTEKEEFDLSRGIVRIGIPFIELFVLMFFYSINKWIDEKKKKWLMAIIILATFIVLSVTRQFILLSFVIGGWMLLRSSSIIKRIFFISLIAIFYFFILPNIPIYKTMLELSEEQAQRNKQGEEDIRIQAWRFYTYEYQTNGLTPIFGNGVPSIGNSKWGNDFAATTINQEGGNGCYTVDVGWAGFFWTFGGIATFGLLMLFYKAYKKEKKPKEKYLSYWIVFITLTSIASGPILFYNQIISVSTVLYLIFGNNRETLKSYDRISNS